MKDQIDSIRARLENIANDIILLDKQVGEVENRDKVSIEMQKKLNDKSLNLSILEQEFKDKTSKLEQDREELSRYANKFAQREKQIIENEEKVRIKLENLDKVKKELAQREIQISDSEEERTKLEIEKKDFEIIQAKVEKERQVSRDRKEALDERERKINIKEELLRKRLNT